MKVEILEYNGPEIKIKVDENHTLCNLLVDEIRRDKAVVVSTYKREHPLKNEFIILIKTRAKDTKKVLKEGIERTIERLNEFLKAFESS
ncbi:hypothetical protein DRN63_04520 [Nanoarchaeota archaeon]|nr:MAG: hypothetical protein DRN63_04520 [Nanoarchaeota archaeon]